MADLSHSEVILRHTFTDIGSIKAEEYRHSNELRVRGLPLKITLYYFGDYVYFYLHCDGISICNCWPCKGTFEFRLLHSGSTGLRQEPRSFGKHNCYYDRYSVFMAFGGVFEFEHILNSDNGYIENGSITVEASLMFVSPENVLVIEKKPSLYVDRVDMTNSEMILRHTFADIGSINTEETRYSCVFYVGRLLWKIGIFNNGDCLIFELQCDPDNKSKIWSCQTSFEGRMLCCGKPHQKSHSFGNLGHTFNSRDYKRTIGDCTLKEVLNYENGYIKDGNITVQVTLFIETEVVSFYKEIPLSYMDLLDSDSSTVILRHTFTDISRMVQYSNAFIVHGSLWKIGMCNEGDALRFGLKCVSGYKSYNWSCHTIYEVCLLHSDKFQELSLGKHNCVFSRKMSVDWINEPHYKILDIWSPRNDFITDGNVTVKLTLTAEPREGVSSDNRPAFYEGYDAPINSTEFRRTSKLLDLKLEEDNFLTYLYDED